LLLCSESHRCGGTKPEPHIQKKKRKTLPGVPKLLATSTAIYSFHFEFCGFISLTSEIHLNKSPTFCVLFAAEFFPNSQQATHLAVELQPAVPNFKWQENGKSFAFSLPFRFSLFAQRKYKLHGAQLIKSRHAIIKARQKLKRRWHDARKRVNGSAGQLK